MAIQNIDARDVQKITSGQVITDLVSIVKELVENSIDANSSKIEVIFKNSGLDSIEVNDDGIGIEEQDFESVCLKHCTSKLSTFEQLSEVETLGFRGEALSSLCSISNISITTCTRENYPRATKLEYNPMGLLANKKKSIGGVKGTSITVSNLFHNLPVRQKNLQKNIKREYGKAISFLINYMIISPNIRFTLYNTNSKNNKKTLIMGTKGTSKSTILDNVVNIFGSNGAYGLVPIDISVDNMEVKFKLNQGDFPIEKKLNVQFKGYISNCSFGLGRSSSDRQYLYINGRPILLKKYLKTINEVYKTFNHVQYPVVILNLIINSEFLDINITPDKRIIMIQNEDLINDVLRNEITQFFNNQNNVIPKSKNSGITVTEQSRNTISSNSDNYGSNTNQGTLLERQMQKRINIGNESVNATLSSTTLESLEDTQLRKDSGEEEKEDNDEEEEEEEGNEGEEEEEVKEKEIEEEDDEEDNDNREEEVIIVEDHGTRSQSNKRGIDGEVMEEQNKINIAKPIHQEQDFNAKPTDSNKLIIETEIINKDANTLNKPQSKIFEKQLLRNIQENLIDKSNEEIHLSLSSDDDNKPKASNTEPCIDTENINVNKDRKRNSDEMLFVSDSSEEQSEDEGSPEKGDKSIDLSSFRNKNVSETPKPRHSPNPYTEESLKISIGNKEVEERPVKRTRGPASRNEISFDEVPSTTKQQYKSHVHNLSTLIDVNLIDIIDSVRNNVNSAQNHKPTEKNIHIDNIEATKEAEEKLSYTILKSDFTKMKLIGQFNLGFILVTLNSSNNLFIVDQHASDEKYNFERLTETTSFQNQSLVIPKIIELNAIDEMIVMDNLDVFKQNGFLVEVEDNNPPGQRIKLISLPILKNVIFDISDFHELIHLINTHNSTRNDSLKCSKIRSLLAMRACRSSIMIGQHLNKKTMSRILTNLSTLDKPWNCPHGRPTMRHLIELKDWSVFNDDYSL